MSVRALLNLLLVLALVAGGIGPASAEHRMPPPEAITVDAPPCHGEPTAAEPAKAPVQDCCSDNACTCDCLHVSPLLAVALPAGPSAAAPRAASLFPHDIVSPSPTSRPPLRPPIA